MSYRCQLPPANTFLSSFPALFPLLFLPLSPCPPLRPIDISFAALHLQHTEARLAVFDPRPDLYQHLEAILPLYYSGETVPALLESGRLRLAASVEDAVAVVFLMQEQGPENVAFKAATLVKIADAAPRDAHLWSSTSGIPVSSQVAGSPDHIKSRLLAVHPFNPPHIIPLIELSPGPDTRLAEVDFAKPFLRASMQATALLLSANKCPALQATDWRLLCSRKPSRS